MTHLRKCTIVGLLLLGSAFVLAAAQDPPPATGPQKAVCVLTPTKKSKVSGVITFTVKKGGVHLAGEITGLTPGPHGFHVHQYGDLNSADGTATGGHFNPDNAMHGDIHDKERHVGDLGNIDADGSGTAVVNITDKLITLSGKHSVIGRALIVHAKKDDGTTQPSGDAGGRVAQGVIGIAK